MNEALRAEWHAMRQRMVALLASGGCDLTDDYLHIDSDFYTSQQRFEQERALLLRVPIFAGLSSEVANPGDIMVFDELGPSVIIVRAAGGELNAFLNLCPHRGMRLVEQSGNRQDILCPYHAWRFDLAGQLKRRPIDEGFEPGSNDCLVPVAVAEWAGMVFVQVEHDNEPLDIRAHLGDIGPVLEAMELGAATVGFSRTVGCNANWKLLIESNSEPYHVPMVHPKTINHWITPYVYIQDDYGKHHRYASPSKALKPCVDIAESEWPDSNYSAVHFIYPNVILTMTGDPDSHLTIQSFFPGGSVGQSVASNRFYIPFGKATPERLEQVPFSGEFIMSVLLEEDFPMAEGIWNNIRALPRPVRLQIGRNENAIQGFHRDLAADTGLPL